MIGQDGALITVQESRLGNVISPPTRHELKSPGGFLLSHPQSRTSRLMTAPIHESPLPT